MSKPWESFAPAQPPAATTQQKAGPWDDFSAPAALPPPAASPAKKPEGFIESGAAGFKRSLPETKSLLYGAGAVAADLVGADGLRDKALSNYERIQREEVAPLQGGSGFIDAVQGKGNLAEWAGDTLGNFGGQALQSIAAGAAGAALGGAAGTPAAGVGAVPGAAVGAVGGIVARKAGKELIQEGVEALIKKKLAEGLTREAAEAAGKAYARRELGKIGGATLAATGLNVAQETGIAYTGRTEDAAAAGEQLTTTDALRAVAAGVPAGLLDTVAEGLTVSRALKGVSADPNLAKRMAAGALQGGVTEAGTEAAQGVLERAGAARDLTSQEAFEDYIENAAAGALGGGVSGAAGGIRQQTPEAAPLALPGQPAQQQAQPVAETAPVQPDLAEPGTLTRAAQDVTGAAPLDIPGFEDVAPAGSLTAAAQAATAAVTPAAPAAPAPAAPAAPAVTDAHIAVMRQAIAAPAVDPVALGGMAAWAEAVGQPQLAREAYDRMKAGGDVDAVGAFLQAWDSSAEAPQAPAINGPVPDVLDEAPAAAATAAAPAPAADTGDAPPSPTPTSGLSPAAPAPTAGSENRGDDPSVAPSAAASSASVPGSTALNDGEPAAQSAPSPATTAPDAPTAAADSAGDSVAQAQPSISRPQATAGAGERGVQPAVGQFKPGPNGARYRVSTTKAAGGAAVVLEKRTEGGFPSSFYVGADGILLDAETINFADSDSAAKVWRPTAEQAAKASELLDSMGRLSSLDPARKSLEQQLRDLVTGVAPTSESRVEAGAGTPDPWLQSDEAFEKREGVEALRARIANGQAPLFDFTAAGDGTVRYFAKGDGPQHEKMQVPLELTAEEARAAKLARQEMELAETPEEMDAARANLSAALEGAARRRVNGEAASKVATAAAEAATSPTNDRAEPTEAQKEAGNYKKGHTRVAGLDVTIENPAGTSRRPEWPPLQNHYGYFKGTVGKDKDHVDVFLTDRAEDTSLPVFVVDQIDPKTGKFDEHKVVMGVATAEEARATYAANYAPDWQGLGGLRQMTQDEFKAWVRDPKKTKKPASGKLSKVTISPNEQSAPAAESAVPAKAAARVPSPAVQQEAWNVRNARLGERYTAAQNALRALTKRIDDAIDAANVRLPEGFKTIPYPDRGMPDGVALQDADGNDIAYPLSPAEAAERAWREAGRAGEQFADADALRAELAPEIERLRSELHAAAEAWNANGEAPMAGQWKAEREAKQARENQSRVRVAKAAKTREEKKAAKPDRDADPARAGVAKGYLRITDADGTPRIVNAADWKNGTGPLKVYGLDGEPAMVLKKGAKQKTQLTVAREGATDFRGQPKTSTAPEHIAVEAEQLGATDADIAKMGEEFTQYRKSASVGEVHHVFDDPAPADVVRLEKKAGIRVEKRGKGQTVYHRDAGWMTPAEAKARIAEWKAHAAAQGKTRDNSNRIVLSLFDLTGEWSRPWEEAGYQVYRFDIQDDWTFEHENDDGSIEVRKAGDINNMDREFFTDMFGDFDGNEIYAILAANPCTDFTNAGARHFAAKDADGRTISSVRLVHKTLALIEHFKPATWAMENPAGRIDRLTGLPPWRLAFDPYQLGDTYTKRTHIWGRFNADLPIAPVEPTEGSKMHKLYGGKSIETKNARSETPEGFAYAFFMANNAIDHPILEVAGQFDRLPRAELQKALDAGLTVQEIRDAVEDAYYQDLDDDKAVRGLREAVEAKKGTLAAAFKDGDAVVSDRGQVGRVLFRYEESAVPEYSVEFPPKGAAPMGRARLKQGELRAATEDEAATLPPPGRPATAAAATPAEAANDMADPDAPVALHVDGADSAAATPAEIAKSARIADRKPTVTMAQAKKDLLAQIDKAIAEADSSDELRTEFELATMSPRKPTKAEINAYVGATGADPLRAEQALIDARRRERIAPLADRVGYITFDVEGNGSFKVLNVLPRLQAFRSQVEKHFKLGEAKGPQQPALRASDAERAKIMAEAEEVEEQSATPTAGTTARAQASAEPTNAAADAAAADDAFFAEVAAQAASEGIGPTAPPAKGGKLRNFSWDPSKLADAYSFAQLNELREQVYAEHAMPRDENGRLKGDGIHLYDREGRRKLDALAWAVTHKLGESKAATAAKTLEKDLADIADRVERGVDVNNAELLRDARRLADEHGLFKAFEPQFNAAQEQVRISERRSAEAIKAMRQAEEERAAAKREADAAAAAAEPAPEPVRMTMEEWKATHRDAKGIIDGQRTVMRGGRIVPVEIIKPTAEEAVAALKRDDLDGARAIIDKLKGVDLVEVGRLTGFRQQMQETVTAFRARLLGVLPELTGTKRAIVKEQQALYDLLYPIARDYTESVKHAELARKNGLPPDSTAFQWASTSVEAKTIDEALPKLVEKVREQQGNPHYAAVADMLRKANPAIFDAAEAKPVAAPAAAPAGRIESFKAGMNAAYDGAATVESLRALYRDVVDNRDAYLAELGKMTKPELQRTFNLMRADSKPQMVEDAYRSMLTGPALGTIGGISLDVGDIDGSYRRATERALEKLTQADVDAFAARVAEGRKKREEQRISMDDPKSLEDFIALARSRGTERKLTPEQRAEFDRLRTEARREERDRIAERNATVRRVELGDVSASITETKHTQKGHDLFVVQLSDRVERDVYNTLNAAAKKLGGYYSSYRGNGATPGFQFTSRDAAEKFVALRDGDQSAADRVKDREAAREESAAESLRLKASALRAEAEADLGRDRKTNTRRQAGMAASAIEDAERRIAIANTMDTLAARIEAGDAKLLRFIRHRSQVELLERLLQQAHWDYMREEGVGWEKAKETPIGPEAITAARLPQFHLSRGDAIRVARRIIRLPGGKQIGTSILKEVDYGDEYAEAVKANPFRFILQASRKDGSDAKLAAFDKKRDADAALAGSADKRIGVVVKMPKGGAYGGQYVVALAPDLAIERKLWEPDYDKKVGFTPEGAAKILKLFDRQKIDGYDVPHWWQAGLERRAALAKLGIERDFEYREALREFLEARQAPAEESRVRKLEIALAGRKDVGVDFFPTPPAVVQRLIEQADIQPGMRVLEPSAGKGDIAIAMREAADGVLIDTVEFSGELRELLEAKGFDVIGSDFIDLAVEPKYDRIVMNPPFLNDNGAQHVKRAYQHLKPGGRLVAVMGAGQRGKADFDAWLDKVGGSVEPLPEGSFKSSFRPTGVATQVVVVEKGYQRIEGLDSVEPQRDADVDPVGVLDADIKVEGLAEVDGFTVPANLDGYLAEMEAAVALADGELDAKANGLADAIADARRALPNGPEVEFHRGYDGLPEHLREGQAKRSASYREGQTAAMYDPTTGKVYVFTNVVKTPAAALWNYMHEVAGHHGLRHLLGERLDAALRAALGNPTVAELATEIGRQRGSENRMLMAEEALAELAAAVRTGRYDRIRERYGVEVPDGMRRDVKTTIRDFLERLQRLLAKLLGRDYFKDSEVRELLEAAWQAADTREAPTQQGRAASLQARAANAVFYSALGESIEAGKGAPKAADAAAWKGWLDGAQRRGEFRAGEREWLGLDAWLDAQGGKVTRQQLADYVRAHQVQVEDVLLGGGDKAAAAQAERDLMARGWEFEEGTLRDPSGAEFDASVDGFNEAVAAAGTAEEKDALRALQGGEPAKFADYQLAGGKNYRELLLTLPPKAPAGETRFVFENDDATDDFLGDVSAEGFEHLDYGRDDGTTAVVFNGAVPPEVVSLAEQNGGRVERDLLAGKSREELARLYEAEIGYNPLDDEPDLTAAELRGRVRELAPAAAAAGAPVSAAISGDTYVGGHWSQPNVLAHVRFNERTDADGKRVLFLEEIQSDWHQAGRKRGYTGLSTAEQARKKVLDATPPAEWSTEDMDWYNARVNDAQRDGVPDAPLKSTDEWSMLAFKRMVRWAAEQGFDRIAWTTGAQQAERYDLSKQISRIELVDAFTGGSSKADLEAPFTRGSVRAYDHQQNRVIDRMVNSAAELADLVGKEAAEKLLAQGGEHTRDAGVGARRRSLSGLDLKVGGEGMHAFYDKMLPSAVNKWAKRFGAKAAQTRLMNASAFDKFEGLQNGVVVWTFDTRFAAAKWADAEPGRSFRPASAEGDVVHAIDVTPAMRSEALAGLPLFNVEPAGLDSVEAAPLVKPGRRSFRDWWKTRGRGRLVDMKPSTLALVPLNHLVDWAPKGMTGAHDYVRQQYQMQAFRNGLYQRYDAVAQDWLRFSTTGTGVRGLLGRTANDAGTRLADLMHSATLAGIDPALDESTYSKHPEKGPAYRKLREQYDALGEQGQALYRRVRDAYSDHLKLLEATIEENIRRAMEVTIARAERKHADRMRELDESGLAGDDRAAKRAQIDADLEREVKNAEGSIAAKIGMMRQKFEAQRVEAPYFPLKRFGKYWATVLDADGHLTSFSKFESAADLAEFVQQQQAAGNTVRTKYEGDETSARELIDPAFVAEVEGILDDAQMPEAVKDEVWQAYLERLPDVSHRKAFIHRKKTPGFAGDALRAFSHSMFHGSYQLARLKFGLVLEDALDRAKDQARNSVAGGQLVEELSKRHAWVMNPTGSRGIQALTTAAFVYHLGANPAHLLLNATQTVMMGVPILGSRHGFGKAVKALQQATADFARGRGHIEKANLTSEERDAFERFMASGLIDKTQAHDLAGVGENGVEYSAVRQRVMNKLGWFFHQSERFNREVTAMAAYRLARAAGKSHGTAVEQAMKDTYSIHFDYSSAARPRAMQGDLAKLLLVFRNYNVNMLYRLFRDAHQSFKGETVQVRREARKQLGAIFGMYGLMAGTMGVPLYGLAMALAGMFEDDDDALTAEQQFVLGMREWLGEDAARVLLRGIPGALTGVDLTERIGMPNLWFRSPDREMEGRDAYYFWLEQILGATPGLAKNVFDGLALVNQGHVERGVERMLPAAARNMVRAVRFAATGQATTIKGDAIAETGAGDVLRQALGYTPLDLTEQYEENDMLKGGDSRLQRRRQRLIDRYFMAAQAGESEDVQDALADITAYNLTNPAYAINAQTIRRSGALRERNRLMNQDGVVLTRRMRAMAEANGLAPAE